MDWLQGMTLRILGTCLVRQVAQNFYLSTTWQSVYIILNSMCRDANCWEFFGVIMTFVVDSRHSRTYEWIHGVQIQLKLMTLFWWKWGINLLVNGSDWLKVKVSGWQMDEFPHGAGIWFSTKIVITSSMGVIAQSRVKKRNHYAEIVIVGISACVHARKWGCLLDKQLLIFTCPDIYMSRTQGWEKKPTSHLGS